MKPEQENKSKSGIPFLYFFNGTKVHCGFKTVSYKFTKNGFQEKEKTITGEGEVICTTMYEPDCKVETPSNIYLWVKLLNYVICYDITRLITYQQINGRYVYSWDDNSVKATVYSNKKGQLVFKEDECKPILNVINHNTRIIWTIDEDCIMPSDPSLRLYCTYRYNRLCYLAYNIIYTKTDDWMGSEVEPGLTNYSISNFIVDVDPEDIHSPENCTDIRYWLRPTYSKLDMTISRIGKELTAENLLEMHKHLKHPIIASDDIDKELKKREEILRNYEKSIFENISVPKFLTKIGKLIKYFFIEEIEEH